MHNLVIALFTVTVLLGSINCQWQDDFSFGNSRGRTTLRPQTQRTTTSTRPVNTPAVPGSGIEVVVSAPCTCPFTPEYNPVCGTDGQTYGNRGILNCHTSCGRRVQFAFFGACRPIQG